MLNGQTHQNFRTFKLIKVDTLLNPKRDAAVNIM